MKAAAALLALVAGFYVWTASSSGRPIRFERQTESTDLYNQLVDGFLKGQLSLAIEPPRALGELPNPYDPVANRPYRDPVHDVSYYDGKFYLCFGITPAVTLLLPFRLVTGGVRLSIRLAVVMFALGGLLAQLALFRRHDSQDKWLPLAVIVLSLSSFVPFVLRRPAMYELAICSGYFFFFTGLYFLMVDRMRLGSLCLGLAIGSRPTYLFAAAVVLCVWLWRTRKFAALLVPIGATISMLLLYNYLRFEQPFEFGHRYQLAGYDPTTRHTFFSPRFFLSNAYAYFLRPPVIDRVFPFFHFPAPPPADQLPPGHLGLEPITGVFASVPFLLLIFARKPTVFTGVGAVMAVVVCCFAGGTERYLVDFVPSLLFASLLTWIALEHVAVRSIGALLLIYGIAVNLALSLTGHSGSLNREAFEAIRSLFHWLER